MTKFSLSCTFFLLFVFQTQSRDLKALLDSLNNLLINCKADTAKIKILDALALNFSKIDPKKGLIYAGDLKKIALRDNNKLGLATAYIDLGINYSADCNYPKSLDCYKHAIKLYQDIGNIIGKATAFANISLVHLNQSDYSMALKNAFDALSILENTKDYRLLACVQENIGTIYLEQKQFKKALHYYSLAYDNYLKISDLPAVARVIGNKGIILNEEGEYYQALKCHLLALKNNRIKGLKRSEQINLANIAITFGHLNNQQKALTYHLKAFEISLQINDKKSMGVNLGNIGETYLKLADQAKEPELKASNLQKAIQNLRQATAICEEIKFNGPLIEFKKHLAEAYALGSQFELAFKEYKSYTNLKDTVYAKEVQKEIFGLETKRELELKNKEIILKEQQKEIMQLEAAYKKNERLLFILSILLLTIIIFVLSNFLLRRLKRHRSSLKEIAHIQSHEARAPLVRILGLIQLLDYKDYTALDKEQVLSYIKQSALELDDVIKKIVDKTDCVPENQRKKHLFNVTFRKK